MRILFITENYPPNRGGMAQSCDRIVRSLRKEGIEIHIFHFTNRKKPFVRKKELKGSYVAIPQKIDEAHTLQLGMRFLLNHYDTNEYDAILCFGGLLPIMAGPTWAKLAAKPLYTCFRGNDFDIALYNLRRRPSLKEACEESETVFMVSSDKADLATKLFDCKKVVFTPNSIELEDWMALESEKIFAQNWRKENSSSRTVIGLFGFLKEKKGVHFFLQAIKNSSRIESIHLVFSGDLEEEIRDYLQLHQFHYSNLPFMDRMELIPYYVACDFVAIPSFYEGMPNVLLEAGGLRIPVLASNIDGMKDVIEHEKDSLLFKVLDQTDCIHQLRKMLDLSIDERKLLGEKLFLKIKEDYTPAKEISHYINVLNSQS